MTQHSISSGTVHDVPADMQRALRGDRLAHDVWEGLTILARNEWICWVISVKQDATRHEHIARMIEQLKEGKRRPCCWIGCIHRKDKPLSPSVRGILAKRGKK